MTVNDVPELREIFAWARMQPMAVNYTLAGNGKEAKAKELLIRSPRGL
jgi:DNA adenine methylase